MNYKYFWLMNTFCIFFIFIGLCKAYDPCQGKSHLGGQCERDRDCSGFGVVCRNGKCDCHINYQAKVDSDGSSYCVKLPDTIGSACSGQCRFPMFCSNGQCQCVRATVDGNRCYPSSKLGDSCTQDAECSQPFTFCNGGRCSCVAGASSASGQCSAPPHCPDGARPSGNCVRQTYDTSEVQNSFAGKRDIDTCPANSYCYTTDNSISGHCCPITCPYNTAQDTSYSCAPKAQNPCPTDTHYCHRLTGQSFSVAACCRRPCKEPTPLYVNGKCYARAWLGGPCTTNEQCLGGDTMQCSNGQCICRGGYSPQTGTYITSENPPQTCVKSCGSSPTKDGECFSNANLGGQCDVDDQCPQSSKCLRGQCVCNCLLGYSRSGNSCIKAAPTTQAPGAGVTNSGGGGLVGLIGNLFKGGSGSSSSSSGGSGTSSGSGSGGSSSSSGLASILG